MLRRRRFLAIALLASLTPAVGFSAEPLTRIDVTGMHCVMCAKKISTKMQAVPGVANAVADPKTGIVIVTAKPSNTVSPKSLWEGVELAGYKPVRLAGPAGTFDSKPRK